MESLLVKAKFFGKRGIVKLKFSIILLSLIFQKQVNQISGQKFHQN